MNQGFTTITPAQARSMMTSNNDIVLLDVRETEEFAASRIPGARNCPLSQLKTAKAPQVAHDAVPAKDATLLVYCKGGRRSKVASSLLAAMGYRTVYDIGGITSWPYDIDTQALSS